jgi:hypothetical protein
MLGFPELVCIDGINIFDLCGTHFLISVLKIWMLVTFKEYRRMW